jgi:hypothetical protein
MHLRIVLSCIEGILLSVFVTFAIILNQSLQMNCPSQGFAFVLVGSMVGYRVCRELRLAEYEDTRYDAP